MLITFILTIKHYFRTFLFTMLDIYIPICYTMDKFIYLKINKMETTLGTFKLMFTGYILFGYITLGLITFIKNLPYMQKYKLSMFWKVILLIFCILITPMFFIIKYKIVERD